jgi:hypothetical protein
MAYRNYSSANGLIVAKDGNGDFSTITAAMVAATSGQTIQLRDGTYTENFTWKPNVSLTSWPSSGLSTNLGGGSSTSAVTILGTVTISGAGTFNASGIQFQTNGAAAIATSGSNSSSLYFSNCTLNANNATGMTLNNASNFTTWSFCYFVSAGTNQLFAGTAGPVDWENCIFSLSATATASSIGTSNMVFNACDMHGVSLVTANTGSVVVNGGYWQFGGTTLLTTVGTGTCFINGTILNSTSATAISLGTGTTLTLSNSIISSSATNAIGGAGTLNYGSIVFSGTSSGLQNTLILNPLIVLPVPSIGTVTQHDVLVGGTAGAIASVGPGTSLQVLQSGGASANPAYSTATYPASTTVNQLLYSSSANVIAGLTTANGGVVDTTASGVPQVDTTNFSVLSTGVQVKGNNTNTAPPTGFIGEQIRSAATVSLSSTVAANVTSISLTAGIWDVSGIINFIATTGTVATIGISATSATITGTQGDQNGNIVAAFGQTTMVIPSFRVTLASTTTYFLVGQATFVSGGSALGRISATRVG